MANFFSQGGYFINAENLYETALNMALAENKTLLAAQIHLDLAKHFYDNKNYIEGKVGPTQIVIITDFVKKI